MISGGVRLLLGAYALYWVGRYWFWWSTANMSAARGGSLANPFNDAPQICCFYDALPCERDLLCIDAFNVNRIYTPQLHWWPTVVHWLLYVVALAMLVALPMGPPTILLAAALLWYVRSITI